MITLRPAAERGHADHGWLDAHHTFSFADYRDPGWMGFSDLRVLNQDRVAPGRGFGTHGHRDMEIVTWVLDGTLEHRDSLGNGSRSVPGDAQFMSAGRGVTHSEVNPDPERELHLLQMWVLPRERGTTPRYAERHYPVEQRRGRLCLVASPDGRDGSLAIGQDARLSVGLLDGAETIRHELAPGRAAWLHVARGQLQLNGQVLGPGDGAGLRDETRLELTAGRDAELVLWDLPGD